MATILGSVFSGGIGNVLTGLSKVIDSVKGKSPEDAAKLEELKNKYQIDFINAQLEDRRLTLQEYQLQTDTNKIEAASSSLFVAGWRPFIGWICGCALIFQFILRPIITWITLLCGHNAQVPALDMADLFTLLFGMLGLGTMRTLDKKFRTSTGH